MSTPTAEPPDRMPAPESAWQTGGLAVLNAGGSDPYQSFEDGPGRPRHGGRGGGEHPPVNYHAYAACTHGSFHRKLNTVPADQQAVLLLLRRDLKLALKTLEQLQASGRRVAISLKESGYHQVVTLLNDARRLVQFREICARADAALSSTPDLVPFYRAAGAERVEFIPTPYPVDIPEWDFSRPLPERNGIFIGTREFAVTSRNHLAALFAVRPLGVPVTVINQEGRSGRRRLEALEIPQLKIVEGRLDYPAYLQLMSRHRLVFQLDRSAVPGQIAGDALLCGLPCVGGDGAVERLAFPDFCGFGRGTAALQERAASLLADDNACLTALADARHRALAQLAFSPVAARLRDFFRL